MAPEQGAQLYVSQPSARGDKSVNPALGGVHPSG